MIETREIHNLEITIDYSSEINLQTLTQGEPFCRSIRITNHGQRAVNNLTLKAEGFYFEPVTIDISKIGVNETLEADCSQIKPSIDKLLSFPDLLFTQLSISLSTKTRELGEFRLPVRLESVHPLEETKNPETENNEIAGYNFQFAESPRFEGWERKLLDISLRNPMLNMKPGKNFLKISSDDISAVLEAFKENNLTDFIEGTDKEKEEKLKGIYRNARLALEESGTNNLFLTLGLLQWFDTDDNKPHLAPVIFLPAAIVRKKAMTYEIRPRDDEFMINVTLLEMMRQIFGVKFDNLDPLPLDETGKPAWQVIFEILEDHLKEINRHRPQDSQWKILPQSFVGIFSFTKFLMWNDLHTHPTVIWRHNLLKGLIESFYPSPSLSKGDSAASEFEKNLFLPIDFDSSQLKAVYEAHKGESFVIYGPPGTGKSQTITNMIADAIANGKRVLFVAEKKAALDVVEKRLQSIGLSPFCLELHSNKTDKKSFFKQLHSSYVSEIGAAGSIEGSNNYLEKKDSLNRLTIKTEATSKSLHSPLKQGVSIFDCITGFTGDHHENFRFQYEEISHLNKEEMQGLCSHLSSLDLIAESLGTHPGESNLKGLYPRQNNVENQKQLTDVIKSLPARIDKSKNKSKSLFNKIFRRLTSLQLLKKTDGWKLLEQLAEVSDTEASNIDDLENMVTRWRGALGELRRWYLFADQYNHINGYRIPEVMEYYLRANSGEKTASLLKSSYYKTLAEHFINEDERLRIFNGSLHEKDIEEYKSFADLFRSLTREEIIKRLRERLNCVVLKPEQQKQQALLLRRMMTNGHGVPLRKVIKDSGEILQMAFPCMLMSPLSVAQYLEMKPDLFDIIIFDEASQMETADAIGTIARGKAIVVVGDPKQLPPTRFFTRQTQNGEELEENEDADSILEDCISLGMPSLYLTRHYRSRHESLISFSNSHFYDNKLLTFPSVNDSEIKVKTIDPEGVYDIGRSRTNRKEAEEVVRYILRLIENSENCPSIGVVAFSKAQSNLIEDLFYEKLKGHKQLQQKIETAEEPLFIKNLENVQGDERDIIIFSVGYGPDKNGNVFLNFGPINQSGGERRLNVAVTRAREEMIVFTSLKAYHIPEEGITSKGVEALRKFLIYADGGVPDKAKDEASAAPDSIVERISDNLKEQGYDVKTNVGRSDFKIDIAVTDPENSDQFKLGIILDGKNYASLPTLRDKEIVAPEVLKSLGWTLFRVWAIDWLNNPEKVMKDILKALKDY